jgi:hypothetical protein
MAQPLVLVSISSFEYQKESGILFSVSVDRSLKTVDLK